MNAFDILGAVMQAGMSPSAGDRLGSILGQVMGGGPPGAVPAGPPAGAPGGGGMLDTLSKIAGAALGGGPGAGHPAAGGMAGMGGLPVDILKKVAGAVLGAGPGPGGAPAPGAGGMGGMGGFPGDILKQVAGAVLGGGSGLGNAAAGAGALTVLGGLAAQALAVAQQMMGGAQAQAPGPLRIDDQSAVIAGLRPPQTPQEQQQFADMARLTLQAMISAVKADGQVDEGEKARLLGKLQEGGISPEEQRFVSEEMQKPIDLDALVRAVPNAQAGAQIYTASLLAIEVDTDAERRYLADLAAKLGIGQPAVAYLHQAVGIA